MVKYALRRVLASIPVLFGVLAVTFILARLVPGDPCTAMLGEKATPAVCERFNREKGLDRPLPVQFGIFVGDTLRGDLGTSIRFKRPITQIIVERLPVTIELGLLALIIAVVVGVPAGILSAIRRNSLTDVGTMVGANIGVSMPVFWLGLMLAYIFALLLKDTPFWLPPSGRLSAGVTAVPFYAVYGWNVTKGTTLYRILEFFSNLYIFNSIVTFDWKVLSDAIKHLILPSVALATIPMAIIARMTRSSMLEVLGRDYVRTARAKGLSEQRVILGHAFRNALLPVVTIVGLQLGTVFGGAILTETIFNLAGVGRILFEAITARDYPIIQGFTLVVAVGYVVVNLVVDLSYAFLDPRIRLS
ncbi:MAG: ABC transporter permease [Ardenticatenaceae bacterium]|nr:ABC transporter permease [Ardenticatenaceae bacterium]HBY94282.1 peptide ABC transporter permease [Chloroflexota bacterium]